ncbi:MAG: addiction module component CHP02574 family protein [Alteromonadaceae bacterium]|nr:addiction module component CHP02574 family protein [Alteromonadaceae bacterium]
MNTSELVNLSLEERMTAMEALWDSMKHDLSNVDSPEWHGLVLSQREEKIASRKANFISLDELKKARK